MFLGVRKLVSYFDYGMSSSMKQLLETMCGGNFMSKNPEEAMDFLSYVAEVSRGWDEPNAREVGRMESQPNAKGRMYVLNEDIGMKQRRYKKCKPFLRHQCKLCLVPFVNLIGTYPITMLHMATPTIEIGGTIQISLENQRHLTSNLEQAIVNLSKVVGDFVGDQKSINAQLNQRIDSMEKGESSKVREVKAVITLRNGKEIDQPISKPKHDEESVAEKEKSEENKGKRKGKSIKKDDHESRVDEKLERIVIKEDMMKKHMPPPFP
ncbi:hypothetical protein AAG906_035289 [Vitis piasezkii]